MGITRALNGADITRGPLVIRELGRQPEFEILAGPRVGIRRSADWPLRFAVAGNAFLSRGPRRRP